MAATTIASRPRAARSGWVIYAVLALLFGVYLGINSMVGLRGRVDIAAWKPLVWETTSVIVIFALIPLVVRFEAHFRLDARPRWRIVMAHMGAALIFSALHVAGILLLRKLVYAIVGQQYGFDNLAVQAFYELQRDLITYVVILVVIFANREFQVRRTGDLRAAELAAELDQARLKALTAQIEPHFLFNTLNAISNRMHEDVEAADRMISSLGSLLRAAYDSDNQVLVPLERELSWLRDYAAMMTERFRGQLSFNLKVAPGLEGVAVPRLLLQPLVENALRHGLPDGRGDLTVEVARQGPRLLYTISDNGVGIDDTRKKPGTGLSNVARRLELLFPGTHTFTLAAAHPTGTVVTLSFPLA
ncbi:MAG TPA: histidine kinase [Steroidobacteraceae bacterium]|jgi:two-component system, LytTR family, sensor kinase|nr:histidine kinase [Steroidobacteraceae bacterium]